jgi:hypothetical protein
MPEAATVQMISVVTTVALAFVGYIVTYLNNVRLEERKAKLKYISDQLQYLYGPLFSLSNASTQAWEAFRTKFRPDGAFFDDDSPPEDHELQQWRLWMTEVFMPLNLKMEKAIIENAHLIESSGMPSSFRDLLAHTEVYKAIIKKWERGDFSEHTAYLNFPDALHPLVKRTYESLKRRQSELIGT